MGRLTIHYDAEAAGILHCNTASLLRVCERRGVMPTLPTP